KKSVGLNESRPTATAGVGFRCANAESLGRTTACASARQETREYESQIGECGDQESCLKGSGSRTTQSAFHAFWAWPRGKDNIKRFRRGDSPRTGHSTSFYQRLRR